jgi:hypothetical protein
VYHYFIAKHISNDKLHYTFSPKNAWQITVNI